jgi:acetyl-CoA C-acetyltransferase
LGNVVSAGMVKAPCLQAALYSGLPETTVCATINKVCIRDEIRHDGVASRSSVPTVVGRYWREAWKACPISLITFKILETPLGDIKLIDGVVHDGLWDLYNNQHMSMCAEKCTKDFLFSRQDQDGFTVESYRRVQEAVESGVFREIIPVPVPQRRGDALVVDKDEEPASINLGKVGASAIVLMMEQEATDRGITPIARILGIGDAAQVPVDFTLPPSHAVPVALANAGLKPSCRFSRD